MFFKKERKKIEEILICKVEELERRNDRIVDCGVCGCLVAKDNAMKGKTEVRTYVSDSSSWVKLYPFTPYYCKRCFADKRKADFLSAELGKPWEEKKKRKAK